MNKLMNIVDATIEAKKSIEKRAGELLALAIETGDLATAWSVYSRLCDAGLLDFYYTTLDDTEYPHLNKVYEDRADWFGRGQDVCFDALIEYSALVLDPERPVPEWDKDGFDREATTAMMWEAIRSGYAGFNNDW